MARVPRIGKILPLTALVFGLFLYTALNPTLLTTSGNHFGIFTSAFAADDRLERIKMVLSSVPSGKLLLQHLQKLEAASRHLLHWGSTSRTDTVLTRKYNPATGDEKRERGTSISLRQDQSDSDVVLDLAHELVHATARPGFDPYDPTLSPGRYIRAAIDGTGGEIDAVFAECTVAQELFNLQKLPTQRCLNYQLEGKDLGPKPGASKSMRDQIAQDFYKVGSWFQELKSKLGPETQLFPLLDSTPPKLFSSTGHAPYPIALYREYEEMTQMACKNSRERMRSTASSSKSQINALLKARCKNIK